MAIATTSTITYWNRDGERVEATLPTYWEICGCCDGEGKTSRAVECDGGGFTASEWAEQDFDFREDYLAGRYDRRCDECGGSGKVRVVDHSKLTDDEAEALREEVEAEREYRAEVAAERRFGC